MTGHAALSLVDLLGLFAHFAVLSVLAVGGAIATAPDMHRYVVADHGWISDAQFSSSIAIAQAAPGPNILFVAVIGWNVAGAWGALATMAGILLPSSVLAMLATRWGTQRRDTRAVRAFTTGMAPLTLGLLLSTGWILADPFVRPPAHRLGALVLIAVSVWAMSRTKISPLWLIALGAVAGMLGWA
jgi:chromate transporter